MEQPILPDLQLFQSFPIKADQNDLEWPISLNLQLFQSFPTKVAQNDLDGQFDLIHNFSNAKSPLSHQKMKCSFLDYIHFLMISRVIQATKVNQNAK